MFDGRRHDAPRGTRSAGLHKDSEHLDDLVAARGGGTEQGEDFFFGEDALGLLCYVEDAIDQFVGRGDTAFFEPEDHVGAAAERANFNHLL